MAGVIGTGMTLGKIGESLMLNYTKKQYEEKIGELETYNVKLQQHLTELEGLKSQIPTFWKDEQGEKAAKSIEKALTQVKSASKRIKDLRTMYGKRDTERY